MLPKSNLPARRTFAALLSAAVLANAAPMAAARQPPTHNEQTRPQTPPPALMPEEQEMELFRTEGNKALDKADFAAAEKTFQAGLDKAEVLKDEKYTALFSTGLGDVYRVSGRYEKALPYYNRAFPLFQKLGNLHNVGIIFHNLGLVYFSLKQGDKALECYKSALEINQQRRDARSVAANLNNMGNTSDYLGQYDNALEYYKRALDIEQEMGDQPDIAMSHYNLGLLYFGLGRYDSALEHIKQSLAIRGKLGDQKQIAVTLNNLGVVYDSLGQYDKALDCHNRALAIRRTLGVPQEIAASLLNLGNVFTYLGQHDKALRYYQDALNSFKQSDNREMTAKCLNNLGAVYLYLGQNEKALDYHMKALAISRALNSQSDIAASLNNVGTVYGEMGRFNEALNYLKASLAMRKQSDNSDATAQCIANLGALYFKMGRFEEALDCDNRALNIFHEFDNLQETTKVLKNLGEVYTGMRRYDKAQATLDKAVQQYERFSEQVDAPDQVGVLQDTLDLYTAGATLQLRRQHPENALVWLERGRAQGLTRQLAQSRVNYEAIFSPEDAVQWRNANLERTNAGNLLGVAESRLQRLSDQQKGSREDKTALPQQKADGAGEIKTAQAQRDTAKQRDEAAERQLLALRSEMRERYPQFAALNQAKPPTSIQLADLAHRNPDTLYVQWAVMDEETLLLAMGDKDGVKGFRIPAKDQTLKQMAQAWRVAVESYNESLPSTEQAELIRQAGDKPEAEQARALFRTLFAPLQKAGLLAPSRYRRLVLAADGPLLDLPLAALVTDVGSKNKEQNAGAARLIDRYAVSTAVSFGVLTWPGQPNGKAARPLFCIADTAGGTAPERFPGTSGENVTQAVPTASPHGSDPLHAAAPRVAGSLLRGGYGPLREARREGREIVAMFPGATGLAGPLARESEVRAAMVHADILHFAVHNTLDPNSPLRSWLMLAEEDENSAYDGRLEGREVASMQLTARMAVLSACESGRGQQRGGDGLIGMAWAFRGAGCPCVVAAQWKVNDRASRSLMVHFYRNLQVGQRKDEALQRAMQAVRREKGRQSPFWWAGFEVIGDAAPLFAKPAPALAVTARPAARRAY